MRIGVNPGRGIFGRHHLRLGSPVMGKPVSDNKKKQGGKRKSKYNKRMARKSRRRSRRRRRRSRRGGLPGRDFPPAVNDLFENHYSPPNTKIIRFPDGTFKKNLNSNKINKFGWKPQIKLKDGLKEVIQSRLI